MDIFGTHINVSQPTNAEATPREIQIKSKTGKNLFNISGKIYIEDTIKDGFYKNSTFDFNKTKNRKKGQP